jgi:hypothetical protein
LSALAAAISRLPMLTVHVRVNDAATGKPTPVRLRFLDEGGNEYVPFGRLAPFVERSGIEAGGSVQLGTEHFVYIDGACEIRLPAGLIRVDGTKGLEYSPLRRQVTLGPGQISLRLGVERWIDLRAEGWYSGDTRVHGLTPHTALLEGAAEDLAVVNLLAEEKPATADKPVSLPNLLAFSGAVPALAQPGHVVVVNTLNSHPYLGAVSLLNSHRAVYPLRFGSPGPDDWSVADWCDQCHRKRGLVVWPDLARLCPETPQAEALAALLLGKIDAFEVSRFPDVEPETLGDWYRLLDCGFRLPLAGGSAKNSNTTAIGAVRTYARLEPESEFSYAAWIDAIRAGRTFVTNGPLLTLTIDDRDPGAVLALAAGGKRVRVRAEVRSAVPIDQLEILGNGQLLAAKPASGNRQAALLEIEPNVTTSGWLAARCWSQERLPGGADGQVVYAHTSPVYFLVEGQPSRPAPATAAPLLGVLERACEWVDHDACCSTAHHREHLRGVLKAAHQELLRRVQG